jgi:hydroxypyruvate reductase
VLPFVRLFADVVFHRYTRPVNEAELRKTAEDIFRAGVSAAVPHLLLKDRSHVEDGRWCYQTPGGVETWEIPAKGSPGRILVLGAGKAAASLALSLEETLGERITSGRIVVKHGHGLPLRRIVVEEGGHPLPDSGSQSGTRRLIEDLKDTRADDRVFFVLTGGASALLAAPAAGLTLEDKIETTRLLLRSGATIQEINTVRKHLSAVKGGHLVELIHPAQALTLIVSDVVGDDLSSIGSGPTAPDPSTFSDCLEILRRRDLAKGAPERVLKRLEEGARGAVSETPKPGDPLFARVRNLILASNRLSIEAAAARAHAHGFATEVFAHDMVGSTHDTARAFASRLLELAGKGPFALLAGGETTLEVKGKGEGGRNQEFALVAARAIEGRGHIVILSAGTDGTDGPTDAAGALVDGRTLTTARSKGLDPDAFLENNDSYNFFNELGDLLRTGPTGTNVMDLVIGLAN